MADKILKELTLKIWRQKDAKSKGEFKTYKVHNISTGTSFLEMLDILNEQLVEQNEEPVAFDHDCREGICGTCSLFVDGRAHGPDDDVTTCQLHMRRFEDGATITIEPWRCGAFPVIKDLIVDRKAYDKILQAGGYVSVLMPMQFQLQTTKRKKRWTQQPVSDAEPVRLPVKTLQLCCSWQQKFLS